MPTEVINKTNTIVIKCDGPFYDPTRYCEESWVKTQYFCMQCGKQTVWFRDDGGDYYVGEQHMCSDCGASWDMPGSPIQSTNPKDQKRLRALQNTETQNS